MSNKAVQDSENILFGITYSVFFSLSSETIHESSSTGESPRFVVFFKERKKEYLDWEGVAHKI